MARCPSNNDYHDRHRAEHTVATYVARYRCFVGSGDVLSRLASAATGTKINIRDRITLDYIRKYGLDADIAIFILKYQYTFCRTNTRSLGPACETRALLFLLLMGILVLKNVR